MKRLTKKFKIIITTVILSIIMTSASSCDILLEILDELSQPPENTEKKEEPKKPSGKTMKKIIPAPEQAK